MATCPTFRDTSQSVRRSNPEPYLSRVARDAAEEDANPNHHLWRNGRLWWVAFTVHRGHLQERVRFSLKTADVEEARRRRDEVFSLYRSAEDCKISLRLASRRTRA